MEMSTNTLIDPASGKLVFKVDELSDASAFAEVQRLSLYTLVLVTEGDGVVTADFAEHALTGNMLLCFAPFQPYMISASYMKGYVVYFHPDFFCIHRHDKAVGCNGVLFNNIYTPPVHSLPGRELQKLLAVIADMKEELQQGGLSQTELLVSYLKVFLITASRSKQEAQEAEGVTFPVNTEPFVVQKLKDAIEEHYRQKHAASDYASLLHLSPKALSKIVKTHFNKTLTNLIAERIVIEAKRELYLTAKPVKAIAWELGFDDEYHFSRFFKNKADVSPQIYRNTVGMRG